MANKRIELEQHQRFTDLLEEYPNSSRRKKGLTIVFIAAMLLVITFMILGFVSNTLAKDPENLLKKPESKTESTLPDTNQFTLPQSPTESVPPSGSPTTPSPTQIEIPLPQENPNHSRNHSRQSYTMHKKINNGEVEVLSAEESELLAMASPTSSEASPAFEHSLLA
ncbi:MAG: OadG family protein, partial [Actinomycetota bacterium]|nr:OadG family protein [Actinomycetota bacterium]